MATRYFTCLRQRRIPRKSNRTFLCCVCILLCVTLFIFLSPSADLNYDQNISWSNAPGRISSVMQTDRVFIWEPGGECSGLFVSEPAEHGQGSAPYAIVRDAIIDWRLSANSHFLDTHPNFRELNIPFIRIVVFMTLHMSVRGDAPKSSAILWHRKHTGENNGGQTSSPHNISVKVDYFQQIESHLNRVAPTAYKPGMTNQKGISLTEWQVSLSLFPESAALFQNTKKRLLDTVIALSKDGWDLHLDLPLRRFDGHTVQFRPVMSLACATGWFYPRSAPPQLNRPSCPASSGAVLFSGSALHGEKNRDAAHYHEVGHFAARALHGPIEFDAVAISIIPPYTVSHQQKFQRDAKHAPLTSTRAHLERIRASVEFELTELNVPVESRARVILAPVCRLGSFVGEERGSGPCSKSFWNGQYMTLLVLYSMLSPSFQWAASLDLDEVLLGRPTWTGLSHYSLSGKAHNVLNRVSRSTRTSHFTSGWLNFLSSKDASRNLTLDIMRHRLPQLKPVKGKKKTSHRNCFVRRRTGKPAVRCEVGAGFTIHSAIIRNPSKRSATLPNFATSGLSHRNSELLTWHPRLKHSSGECSYIHV